MGRILKVGDRIKLKPHTLLGLTEYTWGIILIDEYDINPSMPYKVKVMGNPPGVVEGLTWTKQGRGYTTWVSKDEYVDAKFTSNKFK